MQISLTKAMNQNSIIRLVLFMAFAATVGESLIVPFYPQFFNSVSGIKDPDFTGKYLTICRVAFVAAYPIWAFISKKIPVFSLLVFTLGSAGIAGIYSAFTENFTLFCCISVLMTAFKSSYMLLYPFIVNTGGPTSRTITTTGIIVHAGFILAAVSGGLLFEYISPQKILLISALLDFIQMGICAFLSGTHHLKNNQTPTQENRSETSISLPVILLLTFAVYFTMSVTRPFYTSFLNERFPDINLVLSGFIFIIPSVSVLLFLQTDKNSITGKKKVSAAFLLLPSTLFIQAENNVLVAEIAVRLAYGAVLFIIMTAIDTWFFSLHSGENASIKYSYLLAIQNLAYLTAPILSGKLVSLYGFEGPVYFSFFIALATIPIYLLFTKPEKYSFTFK
jgi:MFS transporter, DHA1 family, multidrug resistance protein